MTGLHFETVLICSGRTTGELDVGILRIGAHVRQVGEHQHRALRVDVAVEAHRVARQLRPRRAVALPERVPVRGDDLFTVHGLHSRQGIGLGLGLGLELGLGQVRERGAWLYVG